jgi:hypothetical protein
MPAETPCEGRALPIKKEPLAGGPFYTDTTPLEKIVFD